MGTVRPSAKGRAEVLGYRLAWEAFGAADRGTLLCLHGGPGVPHGYLTCLADLARFGYRVVFYDQLLEANIRLPKVKIKTGWFKTKLFAILLRTSLNYYHLSSRQRNLALFGNHDPIITITIPTTCIFIKQAT